MSRPVRVLVLASLCAALIAGPVAAGPAPAGERIANRASATYFNTRLGILETVRSNTVEVEVLPVAGMTVTGGQNVLTSRGGPGLHVFEIENTGNVPLDAAPSLIRANDDDFDVAGMLVEDLDGDGRSGPGDTSIPEGGTLTLQPGARRTVLHVFATPRSVSPGDVARSTLAVTGSAEGAGPDLTGDADASVRIVATALAIDKSAGYRVEAEEIDYVLSVRNNAESPVAPYAAIDGQALTLDGEPVEAVVVRDEVPLNVRFASGAPAGGFRLVHHRRGDPEHAYLTDPPEDARDIDAIAFLHDGSYDVGRASDLGITVAIVDTVDETDIENVAIGYVGTGDDTLAFPSNRVVTPVGGSGHSMIFRNGDDTGDVRTTPFGSPFRIAIGAAACNDTRGVDTVVVTLRTTHAGDLEVVTARETGANTGRFVTDPLEILRVETATQRNNLVEGSPGDAAGAIANASCLGTSLGATLEVQPGGFVFDSVTNEPVAGARVQAFGVADLAPTPTIVSASVTERDRAASAVATPASTEVLDTLASDSITDADGYYDLGAITRGRYRIEVTPPERYDYPSVREVFDGFARRVDPVLSYGASFSFDGGPISGLDIPLDPGVTAPLGLFKSADRSETRRGGIVLYTLDARNNMAQALLEAQAIDTPPGGFRYVEGSATLEGEALSTAPLLREDGTLVFDIGTIGPESAVALSYALRAGPAARRGRAVNTALLSGTQAGTGLSLTSAAARASVQVDDRGGVFTDEAVVMGRVFLDRDGDGHQRGEDEPGVPGVKIVTASGLSVVTDTFGRYSLFGLRPRTTVFAVLFETLPATTHPVATDIDDAQAPGSRFVDLKRGDVRVESFALKWTPEALAETLERRETRRALQPGASRLRDDLPLTFEKARRLGSRNETARQTTTEATRGDSERRPALSAPAPALTATGELVSLDGLDPSPGFLGLTDGDEVSARVIRVRVKSPAGSGLGLSVNGVPIPETSVGTRSVDSAAGVQMHEYVAIRLRAGTNTLALTVRDPFGNLRDGSTVTVTAPGDPAGLRILAPKAIPADPAARVPVVVRVVDDRGRTVAVPAEVTLTAGRGEWDVDDIRPDKVGIQVLVDRGEATFDFVPPDLVGTETIRAAGEQGSAEVTLSVTPDLDGRVIVGVIEGAVSFGEKGVRAIETIGDREISPFEETTAGVEGRLYLKGRIRGDALLTLRYDSDRDTEDRLFRDIRRDEFYPVYGDGSERGFDAQSGSSLYVKVEKGTSYVLYGDIAVEARSDAVQLGAYRRSLTGGRLHMEYGRATVDLFVARTDQSQRVIEIDGRGVSGPYDLDLDDIVDGTEIVELIVRDRERPDVILSAQPQQRLDDYVLDFFADTLVFNRPVPRLDDDLNPVSIRITYETDDGTGEEYLVLGGEARVAVTDDVTVGYRDVRSMAEAPSEERRSVQSAYVEADLRGWGTASVELSATKGDTNERGYGARVGYAYRDEVTSLRIDGAVTDEAFDPPNASIGTGREELRALAEHRLDARTTLSGEALYSRDVATDERRVGAELRIGHALRDDLEVTLGGRAVRTDRDDDRTEVYSGIAGVAWRPRIVTGLALRAEYEQDFVDTDNRRLLLGGDYQVTANTRLYALTEISTTESGRFGLGDGADFDFTTRAGAEYRLNSVVSGFSEYRASPSDGLSGGIAQGLRAVWSPVPRLSLRAGVEHVEPVEGSDTRETSATLGAVWNDEGGSLLLRGDVEADRDEDGKGWYANTSVAWAAGDDLTLLARNRFAIDDRGEGRLRDRLRLGAAWRPAHDGRLQALGLYEYEIDDDGTLEEQRHRWSVATVLHARPRLRTTLKYAGERYGVDGRGFSDEGTLHLVRAGAEFDIVPQRFALGGNVMAFTDDAGQTLVTGAGLELKAHVARNVQLGIGYNHVDVERDRLRDLYRSGLFLRLRLKLDDDLWGTFDDLGLTGE